MLKVAITGNIASGKSQVEKLLSQKGFTVYDSDKIAHGVLDSITEFYNQDVFTDGKIDRKKLGNLVFNNPYYKLKLEEYTHPKIKKIITELFEKHKNEKIVFISVPLLFEVGFDTIFDTIIFIEVNPKLQLKRLMQRNNLSEHDAKLRINAQQPQNEKIKKADFVIKNDSTIENLNNQLEKILNIICNT